MATNIRTISVDDETDKNLIKILDRGTGLSKFVRQAVKFYVGNGYRFEDVPPVVTGDGTDKKTAI